MIFNDLDYKIKYQIWSRLMVKYPGLDRLNLWDECRNDAQTRYDALGSILDASGIVGQALTNKGDINELNN